MSAKTKNMIAAALLLIGAALLVIGILKDEPWAVLQKAVNICLECIGIG